MKKSASINKKPSYNKTADNRSSHRYSKYSLVIAIVVMWQGACSLGLVPDFLLPSPVQVIRAFINDFALLAHHAQYTLLVCFTGVFIGIVAAFILSIAMDNSRYLFTAVYPVLVITQTVPTVALAPLLVIWFGYGMAPKILLVAMMAFFPITIALLDGYRSVDNDEIQLLKVMNANKVQMYQHLKIPASMGYFFAGLKVSFSYALITAVVAEWLGGFYGLGVYMTRVKKAYAIDKMFAVILLVTCLSLLLVGLVKLVEKKVVKP